VLFKGQITYVKVDMSKINTIYHRHTFEATKCMVVVDSVGESVGFRFSVGFGCTYLSMHERMSNIIHEVHRTPIQL
jgi:uncharacterized membrane protein